MRHGDGDGLRPYTMRAVDFPDVEASGADIALALTSLIEGMVASAHRAEFVARFCDTRSGTIRQTLLRFVDEKWKPIPAGGAE